MLDRLRSLASRDAPAPDLSDAEEEGLVDSRTYVDDDGAEVIVPGRKDLARTRTPGHGMDRADDVDHPDYDGQVDPDASAPRGDTIWERAEHMSTTAPIMGNPSMDPANPAMHELAEMAGWSQSHWGHDPMQGVAGMAMGYVDANQELEAPSATEGGPLQLDPTESVYSDDLGAGTHGLGFAAGREDVMGDMAEFHMYDAEAEDTYGGDWDGDWCSCL